MLKSGVWTDRNQATSLPMELTTGRDPDLLMKIRSEALDSLKEMAALRKAAFPNHTLPCEVRQSGQACL
jgi:hypothetical protein